jgi:recombinational DNA repair protein RecT
VDRAGNPVHRHGGRRNRAPETLIMTSRDGYLKVAQRDPNFAGIISFVVRENDTFEIDVENYKVIHKFGAKRGHIIGAWSRVDHKQRKPVITFVDFSEYNDVKSTTWKQYPSAMIQKVAEVFALKRQFGISGLVTREEMASQVKDDEFDGTIDITPDESREAPSIHICEDCKQEITGTARGDAQSIVDYTTVKFGCKLCADCAQIRLREKKEGAAHDVSKAQDQETPGQE